MSVAFAADLAALLDRELRGLRRQLEAYPDERQIWQPVPGLANTTGTLALHIAGNLQHFIGAHLGGTGYVRNRAAEFSRRDVSREELLAEVERARAAVARGLAVVRVENLDAEFPELVAGCTIRTGDLLVHAATHVGYHLGQVDAHRRIVTGDGTGVGMLRPDELGSARKG